MTTDPYNKIILAIKFTTKNSLTTSTEMCTRSLKIVLVHDWFRPINSLLHGL